MSSDWAYPFGKICPTIEEIPLTKITDEEFKDIKRRCAEQSSENDDATELERAIERNDVGGVLSLIADGADVHAVDSTGDSVAFGACVLDTTEVLELLLDAGVSVDVRDGINCTLLHMAANFESLEHVELLLKRGADPDAKGRRGETPIDWAEGALKEADLDIEEARNPAASVCDVVPSLLRHNPWPPHEGVPTLLRKQSPAPPKSLDKLLEERAHTQRVLDCLVKGRWISLERAITKNDVRGVCSLIADGVDVNAVCPTTGDPIATYACWGDTTEVLDLLLDAGLNVDARDAHACTLLHEAVAFTSLAHVQLLVKRGADPEAKGLRGETPIDWTEIALKEADLVIEEMAKGKKARQPDWSSFHYYDKLSTLLRCVHVPRQSIGAERDLIQRMHDCLVAGRWKTS